MFEFLRKNAGVLAPVSGVLILVIAASVLLVQVTLRPWASANYAADTHLNFNEPGRGYSRTDPAYLGETADGPLAWVPSDFAKNSISAGYASYVAYGCASCHGTTGEGTAAGPAVAGSSLRRISNLLRQGPKTMPAYGDTHLPDDQLELIAAYISGLPELPATPEPEAVPTATPYPPPNPTPTPTPPPTPTPVPGATFTPTPEPVDQERLQTAKRLFMDVGCDICHGEAAQGTDSGPALQDLTAEEIRDTVRDPPRPADSQYSEPMDRYGPLDLTDQELDELIFFLLNWE